MKKETIEKFENARVIELYTEEGWTVTKIAKEIGSAKTTITAYRVASYLYNNSHIYLDRKYNKYLEYCRLYEESYRELQTNNGEGCDVNPVISTETKESVPSYRVETEPSSEE